MNTWPWLSWLWPPAMLSSGWAPPARETWGPRPFEIEWPEGVTRDKLEMLVAECAADLSPEEMQRQGLSPLLRARLARRLGLSLAKGANVEEWSALGKAKYEMYTPETQFSVRPARAKRRRDGAEEEMHAERQMHAILGWLAPDAETLPSTWLELDMSF